MLKKILFLTFLSSFSLWVQSQPALFNFTPTSSSATIYGQVEIDGVPATGGDWIAAFDTSGNCCGASQLIMNAGIAYINLVIYGDDFTTPNIDEGMSGNEDFTLKLFQSTTSLYLNYPSNTNITSFSGWNNMNGAPLNQYDDPSVIYNFLSSSSVTFNLNLVVCDQSPAINLSGGQPSGGMYYGNGVSNGIFDPTIAGPGNHTITYVFNNDSASIIATVLGLVDATLITTGPFCDNENNIVLNSVTNGGTYSGNGVIGNSFNPDIVGSGSYWISYNITDSNNCMQNVQTLVTVYSAPQIPQIIQNGNILECGSLNMSYQWFDANMDTIANATSQTYSPSSIGNYYVAVKNTNNCIATSNSFMFSISSLNHELNKKTIIDIQNKEISIYSNSLLGLIELMDISGKLIFKRLVYSNKFKLDTDLNKGIYLIKISNTNYTEIRKIQL